MSPNLTKLLEEAVKKGAVESGQSGRATTIAANVLRPRWPIFEGITLFFGV